MIRLYTLPNKNLANRSQDILGKTGKILHQQDNRNTNTSPVPSEHSATVIAKGSINRLGYSDTWPCKNCKQRGDKWFMRKHNCHYVDKNKMEMKIKANSNVSNIFHKKVMTVPEFKTEGVAQ